MFSSYFLIFLSDLCPLPGLSKDVGSLFVSLIFSGKMQLVSDIANLLTNFIIWWLSALIKYNLRCSGKFFSFLHFIQILYQILRRFVNTLTFYAQDAASAAAGSPFRPAAGPAKLLQTGENTGIYRKSGLW